MCRVVVAGSTGVQVATMVLGPVASARPVTTGTLSKGFNLALDLCFGKTLKLSKCTYLWHKHKTFHPSLLLEDTLLGSLEQWEQVELTHSRAWCWSD